MASFHLFSRPLPTLPSSSSPSSSTPSLPSIHRQLLRLGTARRKKSSSYRFLIVPFALTNSSDSPKPVALENEEALRLLLQELADSFDLPPDFLVKLPRDLRLDLNDAAFDLSNGPVMDECGQVLGEMLLNLSRAWEQADTATSSSIMSKLILLESSMTDNVKAALGKRLVSAGRRFTAMGQYGQGELARIANAMAKTGKLLSAMFVVKTDEEPKTEGRMFKFGELQVELTPEKAYIGATIAFVFGILTWGLAQGIQSIPESSMEYANDNALRLAKSLRGALLALGYSSSVLSAVSSVGLLLLAQQLSSEGKSKEP